MVAMLIVSLVVAQKIALPEGWIAVEPPGARTEGTMTVVPAPPATATAAANPAAARTPAATPAVPAAVRPAARPCLALEERFWGRLAWLHDLTPTDDPISPAVRARLYPGAAGGALFANPTEPPIELSWDATLRDLFQAYDRCVLRHERR